MSIVFAGKIFSRVINDLTNTYHSPPDFHEALGAAEKYFLEVKASGVQSTPTLTVTLEASDDAVNWVTRSTLLTQGISGGGFWYATELGTGQVGGKYARFTFKNTVAGSAYLECWVTGRDAL
jgi:hypothetical protein